MIGFSLLAGVLQLIVPSYALRLVRRFGAQRVGWFVVTAFVCLAMLHLLAPLKAFRLAGGSESTIHGILALGSILLLIGMGHLETLCRERDQAKHAKEKANQDCLARLEQETAELSATNQRLLDEISQLQMREQALAQSNALYDFLFTENPQPMFVIDRQTAQFLTVNRAASQQYGFTPEEFSVFTARELHPRRLVESFSAELARPCSVAESRGVWQHLRKDGSILEVEISTIDLQHTASPARLFVIHDLSQQQQREQRAIQQQKLAAFSKMSGAVGQHFGSIFHTIESNATSLLPRLSDSAAIDHAKQISTAAIRGNGLTRQLLAVGGKHELQTEVLDLNALIRNMYHMLTRLVGERIILQNSYGAFVAPVLADARLLEHVVVNLILNARDAISANGTITISTSTVRLDPVPGDDASPSGEFVRLTVRDNGCGLAPEVQARLFEPFFTTRPSTRTLGLGLASICGILTQHSGWIEFSSEANVGTEFRVFLPCASLYELSLQNGRAASAKSQGTILLVEPDDRIRSMARCALNWQGYRVIEADSSSLALLLWESQSPVIDLLLTDFNLAEGLSGPDLAHQLVQSKPDLKIIYIAEEKTPSTEATIVSKPFTRETLLAKIQRSFEAQS